MLIISFLPALWLALIIAGIFIEAYAKSILAASLSRASFCALAASIAGAGGAQVYVFAGVLAVWFAGALIHKRLKERINIEGQTNAKG